MLPPAPPPGTDPAEPDYPDLSPVEFELASGHRVIFNAAEFWVDADGSFTPHGPYELRFLIRVYTTEGSEHHRMETAYELVAGKEFDPDALPAAWSWLAALAESRKLLDYDSIEDLVEDFEAELDACPTSGEPLDAHVEHLAVLADEEAFDHEDDSIYNDQNDNAN